MSYKIYVVGSQRGYASWMEGTLTQYMEDADVVLLTGGEDINPSIYGDKVGKNTYFSNERDIYEIKEAKKAIELGKVIFGTCRGAQLMCGLAGGKLIQDMNHNYNHTVTLYDGSVINTNSLHHQMQYPYTIPSNEYYIMGYSEGLSKYHLDGNNKEMVLPIIRNSNDDEVVVEPEIIYYKKFKCLGFQMHPEMMNDSSMLVRLARTTLKLAIQGTLELALNLKIPVSRLIDPEFAFTIKELEQDGAFINNGTKEKPVKKKEKVEVYGV